MADPKIQPDHRRAPLLGDLVETIIENYRTDDRIHHLDSAFGPNRARTVQIIELLRRLIFPGFFDEMVVTFANARDRAGDLLSSTRQQLYGQVRQALGYDQNRTAGASGSDDDCDESARSLTDQFLQTIPDLRRKLALDVQAAFDGDPAARNTDEAIFCYPGVDAVFIYRVAHVLYRLEVPMIPRIMTEYAHNETGIDIHPGATIAESFFIDHGTGVVIGETTDIGNRVQIYQGVTLGALAPKDGDRWRGRKRHPTIEDDVTIYPSATILGGETRIGARCVINGSVFLTHSVPPDHIVRVEHPVPQLKARHKRKQS